MEVFSPKTILYDRGYLDKQIRRLSAQIRPVRIASLRHTTEPDQAKTCRLRKIPTDIYC